MPRAPIPPLVGTLIYDAQTGHASLVGISAATSYYWGACSEASVCLGLSFHPSSNSPFGGDSDSYLKTSPMPSVPWLLFYWFLLFVCCFSECLCVLLCGLSRFWMLVFRSRFGSNFDFLCGFSLVPKAVIWQRWCFHFCTLGYRFGTFATPCWSSEQQKGHFGLRSRIFL